MTRKVLTSEEQLRNLSDIVERYTTPSRYNTGRENNYSVSKEAIALAARQLAVAVKKYLDGERFDIEQNDDIPF